MIYKQEVGERREETRLHNCMRHINIIIMGIGDAVVAEKGTPALFEKRPLTIVNASSWHPWMATV